MKSKVHPRYKTKYRVANWAAYNQALVRRGDVTGRWCADAGRPTRFKPSSPSPTDAVRDGSAKLGHPVQNVTREHGLTPLPRCTACPKTVADDRTCTGRTHSPRALADGHQTPSSTVAVRAPAPS